VRSAPKTVNMMERVIDWYPVEKEIQVVAGNKIVNRKAIVRSDNENFLGLVGQNYAVVDHNDLLQTLDSIDLLQRREMSLHRGGASMMCLYDLKDNGHNFKREVAVGDIVRWEVRGWNAYDYSTGYGAEIYGRRLICSNGASVPEKISRINFKHYSDLDPSKFRELILAKVEQADSVIKTWREWQNMKPTENRVKEFFEDRKLGSRMQKRLLGDVLKANSEKGVWGIYNRLTEYSTHELRVRDKADYALRQKEWDSNIIQRMYSFDWMGEAVQN